MNSEIVTSKLPLDLKMPKVNGLAVLKIIKAVFEDNNRGRAYVLACIT